jgi:hypothetical protein
VAVVFEVHSRVESPHAPESIVRVVLACVAVNRIASSL